MATVEKKSPVTKLTSKDFSVNAQTGKVHVSQDKISKLVQTNLDKVRANAGTKAIEVGVIVRF